MQLSDLTPQGSVHAVFDEVLSVSKQISPEFSVASLKSSFDLVTDIFEGRYPGYRACNTGYHDFRHTMDVFLATARLLHGAVVAGERLTERPIVLTLIAALLHDVGYIQEENDKDGTGSKYTLSHVRRSMAFVDRHGGDFGLDKDEIEGCRFIILCTDLAVDISSTVFPSAQIEFLGKMLASADLLAQMADRAYLEKLLFLYYEFREAGIRDYKSEVDLLQKTLKFFEFMSQRFKTTLDSTDRFMRFHFLSKHNLDVDLYQVSIENQRNYLAHILEMPESDPRDHLRRNGIVDEIRRAHP